MELDYNRCIMEQIDPNTFTPQSVADMIFKAKDYRMSGFSNEYEGMYKPLEGLSDKERAFCLGHEDELEQALYEMTHQEYFTRKCAKIKQLINEQMKALK
jgi:hypothetical protein